MSPDFDSFERLLREGLVLSSQGKDIDEVVRRFSLIPAPKRPELFKTLSEEEFRGFIGRSVAAIRLKVGCQPKLTTSENNLSGKDLLELNTGRQIELKSGPSKTDANVGVDSIAWALTGKKNARLSEIMAGSMRERRKAFISGASRNELLASKAKTNDDLEKWFYAAIAAPDYDPKRLASYLFLMSRGVTKLAEIKKGIKGADLPLLLECDLKKGLISYKYDFDISAGITPDITRGNDDGRVTFRVMAEATRLWSKVYPHYKNSYHGEGVDIPAEYWVKTPCFHVWFDR